MLLIYVKLSSWMPSLSSYVPDINKSAINLFLSCLKNHSRRSNSSTQLLLICLSNFLSKAKTTLKFPSVRLRIEEAHEMSRKGIHLLILMKEYQHWHLIWSYRLILFFYNCALFLQTADAESKQKPYLLKCLENLSQLLNNWPYLYCLSCIMFFIKY